ARLRQQMAELDHLSRRQLADIHPHGPGAVDLGRLANRLRHERDHAGLVHGRAPGSNMTMDEDVVVPQGDAAHEQVAFPDLIEDDLREEAGGAGDFGMYPRDFAGYLALLVGREAALPGGADIGRHVAPAPMKSTATGRAGRLGQTTVMATATLP